MSLINTPRLDVMYLSLIFCLFVKTLNSIPATTSIYTLKGMNYQFDIHGVHFAALIVMSTVFVALVLT